MSIPEGEGCTRLGMWSKMIGELYMGMNEVEGSNGDHLYFYARVLREESIRILFITNIMFCFYRERYCDHALFID